MRALVIALLAISAPAWAEAIKIGKPSYGARVDRMSVAVVVKETELVGTIILDVTGSDTVPREVMIPIELASGARASAMTLTNSGAITHASALDATEARSYYHDAVNRDAEPTLLELRGSALALHLFPVASSETHHVSIAVTLPAATQLVVEPVDHTIGRLDVTVDGRTTSTSRLSRASSTALPTARRGLFEAPLSRPVVDRATSLVGRRPRPTSSVMPTIEIGPPTSSSCHFGGREIRKPIKLAHPRLRHCYERELLRDRTLAGDIRTQFLVRRDGKVEVKNVSGTLTDPVVQACVAGVFASLEYPSADGEMLVNYPLTFRASR